MAKSTLLTQREFAARIEVSPAAVNKALKSGRIRFARGTKKINFEEAAKAWAENASRTPTLEKAGGRPRADGAPPKRKRLPESPQMPLGRRGNLLSAQTAKLDAEAQLRQIQVQKLSGLLVEREFVADAVFRWFRDERDALLSFPNRFGPQITNDLAALGATVELRDLVIILDRYLAKYLHERGEAQKPEFTPADSAESHPRH